MPHISIPHIGGLTYAVPSSTLMRASVAGTGGTSYTFNVSGAIDPEGTARALERMIRNHEQRQGRAR